MVGRSLLVLAVLAATAFARHRNAGTYQLAKTTASFLTENGKRMPACDPELSLPESVVVRYTGPDDPVVLVNGDEWQRDGLTTDPEGHVNARPLRVAHDPHAGPALERDVWFRRDGTRATAFVHVIQYDAQTRAIQCATAYLYRGTFTP